MLMWLKWNLAAALEMTPPRGRSQKLQHDLIKITWHKFPRLPPYESNIFLLLLLVIKLLLRLTAAAVRASQTCNMPWFDPANIASSLSLLPPRLVLPLLYFFLATPPSAVELLGTSADLCPTWEMHVIVVKGITIIFMSHCSSKVIT